MKDKIIMQTSFEIKKLCGILDLYEPEVFAKMQGRRGFMPGRCLGSTTSKILDALVCLWAGQNVRVISDDQNIRNMIRNKIIKYSEVIIKSNKISDFPNLDVIKSKVSFWHGIGEIDIVFQKNVFHLIDHPFDPNDRNITTKETSNEPNDVVPLNIEQPHAGLGPIQWNAPLRQMEYFGFSKYISKQVRSRNKD